jgi:hypothetical protein
MRWYYSTAATLAFAAAALLGAAKADAQQFNASLNGFNEVGGFGANETGAILSTGTGTLKLSLDTKTGTANYELDYSGFATTDTVSQARIQFGKPGVPGGILVFLCANSGSTPTAPAGTPLCPASPGKVTGSLTAASVQAISSPNQNVSAGDFSALVAAVVSGTAFANVQTANFPNGEIRGQLHGCQSQSGNGHGNGDGDGNGEGGPGDGDGNGEGNGGCGQNGG